MARKLTFGAEHEFQIHIGMDAERNGGHLGSTMEEKLVRSAQFPRTGPQYLIRPSHDPQSLFPHSQASPP